MIPPSTLLALLLLAQELPAGGAVPVAPAAEPAPDLAHVTLAPAAEMAHEAADAWRAAVAERRHERRAEDDMLVQLFAFAAGARAAADLLGRHDAPQAELAACLEALDGLAARAQAALDAAGPGFEVRRAFTRAQAALAVIQERAWRRGQDAGTAPTAPPGPGERPPEPPHVDVTGAQWAGTFRPDLVLTGRFEGRWLERAEVVVRDEAGRVLLRDGEALSALVRGEAAQAQPGALLAVDWTHRIAHADLADGENLVTVTVTDARGGTASQEISTRPR